MYAKPFCRLVFVSAVLALATAEASECAGVTFPSQLPSSSTTLQLNGLGLRQATFMKVDVYVAGLYTVQHSRDPQAILNSTSAKELVLHFVRDVDGSDLNKGWDEGFEKNAKSQLAQLETRIETFKSWMSDVKSGQQMRFGYEPGKGVAVEVAGAAKGTISGDDFARALFAIWLGPHPPNAALKAGLLGGDCD